MELDSTSIFGYSYIVNWVFGRFGVALSKSNECLEILFALAVLVASLTLTVLDTVQAANVSDFQIYSNPPQANDLKMGGLDGGVFRLSALRGNLILLNFWRKDCPYCVREKHFLKSMLRQLDRSDLKVVCLDLWDSPSWVRTYGQQNGGGLVFASGLDGHQSFLENHVRGRFLGYYVVNEANEAVYEVKGFPSTYVIDKQGRVIASHMGMVDWTTMQVQRWLTTLLGMKESGYTRPETNYELPDWLDRLLSNTVRTGTDPMRGDFRIADSIVAR